VGVPLSSETIRRPSASDGYLSSLLLPLFFSRKGSTWKTRPVPEIGTGRCYMVTMELTPGMICWMQVPLATNPHE